MMYYRILNFIILILYLSFCSVVSAQESTKTLITLPSINTTTVLDGVPDPPLEDGQYKCLTSTQWKTVLFIAVEYRGLYNWRLETQGALNAYHSQVNAYELVLENLEYQMKREKENGEYYKLRLGQVESLNQKTIFRNKFERFALYGIILGELVIISVMGVRGTAN